jgi:hypothetical protein
MAVKVPGEQLRSVHNDTEEEAQLIVFSRRLAHQPVEKQDGFWP